MKIRTTMLSGVIGLLVLIGGWSLLSFFSSQAEKERAFSADQLVASLKLATQLRQSSDDLTRMARIYVSTGEEKYRDYFLRIIAIRNGSAPRPPDYGGFFWDQVLDGSRSVPDEGAAIALRALMERMGFAAEELALLKEAEENSNELVGLEEIAMNAVAGRFQDEQGQFTREGDPDFDLARSIMFGARYHAAKAKIMEPIDRFNRRIEERLQAEMDALHLQRQRLADWQVVIALLTSLSMLGGLWHLRRYVLTPLARLNRDAHALRDREYATRVAVVRDDEIGELGRTFNEMAEAIHADLTMRDQAAEELRKARDEAEQSLAATERARDEAEQARRSLESVNQVMAAQDAIKTRLASLDDHLRGERDPDRLGLEVLGFLAGELGAITGAFFVMTGNGKELRKAALYAGDPESIGELIALGEGLVGSAAKTGKSRRLRDVPPGYLVLRSGLGASDPVEILILPLTVAGEVNGVVELASLSPFDEDDVEFLDIAARHIGVSLEGALAHR